MQDRTTTHHTSTPSSRRLRRVLVTMALGLVTATACAGLPMPGGFGGGQATSQSHSTETREESHTVNGKPVDPQREPAPNSSPKGGAFGATCTTNSECSSNTCFVGHGQLGYCTAMCDSFTDCPKFWDCEKTGNAPQKICQQDAD